MIVYDFCHFYKTIYARAHIGIFAKQGKIIHIIHNGGNITETDGTIQASS